MTWVIVLSVVHHERRGAGAHQERREHPHEGRGQEAFPNRGRAHDLDATRDRVFGVGPTGWPVFTGCGWPYWFGRLGSLLSTVGIPFERPRSGRP